MLYWPHEAEDTTPEILIKLITKLATFQGRSNFRTWLRGTSEISNDFETWLESESPLPRHT
jgi:Sigma-70 region 2